MSTVLPQAINVVIPQKSRHPIHKKFDRRIFFGGQTTLIAQNVREWGNFLRI